MRTSGKLAATLVLGPVRLIVTDLDRSIGWYEQVIGIEPVTVGPDGVVQLAAPGGQVVLELELVPEAVPAGRHAGLYHVALLFESRRELARVVRRIAQARTPIDGVAHHGTHEAIYLADPDGNGLELAWDLPREQWPDFADVEAIRPRPLDVAGLLSLVAGEPSPDRAGTGTKVGHVHLHVGDIDPCVAWYVDVLGFDLITSMPNAAFLSVGGYHHHVAFNTWRGEGVGPPPRDAVGMRWLTLVFDQASQFDAVQRRLGGVRSDRLADGALHAQDPSGNVIRLIVAS